MARRGMVLRAGVGCVMALAVGAAGAEPSGGRLKAVLWIGGFAHEFDTAAGILTEGLGKRIPIDIRVVRDGGFLDAADASSLNVIVMNHCHEKADGVLTEPQEQRLLELVRGGVGVVGLHASYYSFLKWDGFHELFGARFIKHGSTEAMLEVRTTDKQHPIMKGLTDVFEQVCELYESTPLAKDCHVLATAKEKGTPQEYPSVWTRLYGKGRVVTILPGHKPESYRQADFQKLIAASVFWAGGRSEAGKETKESK